MIPASIGIPRQIANRLHLPDDRLGIQTVRSASHLLSDAPLGLVNGTTDLPGQTNGAAPLHTKRIPISILPFPKRITAFDTI